MKWTVSVGTAVFLCVCSAATLSAKDYAIIKEGLFGSRKIELYKSLEEALANYSGEGRIYEITLKPVPVRRVENKKKVEVSEYVWVVDEDYLKDARKESPAKQNAPRNKNPAAPKKP